MTTGIENLEMQVVGELIGKLQAKCDQIYGQECPGQPTNFCPLILKNANHVSEKRIEGWKYWRTEIIVYIVYQLRRNIDGKDQLDLSIRESRGAGVNEVKICLSDSDFTAESIAEMIWQDFTRAVHCHKMHDFLIAREKCPHCNRLRNGEQAPPH